jgi:hypothetical protein
LYQTGQGLKQSFWINCDYALRSRWSFKVRVQGSTYTLEGQTTRGLALIEDVNFDIGRFSFSARYALFDTDNYDNRLYLYERDVSLAFSFPAYNGRGIRRYALVQYKINHSMDIWVRWANAQYTDRETIGTAGESIAGNLKNDVKLQLRVRL